MRIVFALFLKVMLLLMIIIGNQVSLCWVLGTCEFGVLQVLKIKCSNNVPYMEREENSCFLICVPSDAAYYFLL